MINTIITNADTITIIANDFNMYESNPKITKIKTKLIPNNPSGISCKAFNNFL